ncbi:hypothetical protein T07_3911 [Trichinella nelsoni]|uniref:PiggyBac transposable element-derived protein domain-containing protein n=1 Tax=Trichinella nelsoni TaxID=6336 RepID=A0A0V0S431_9BILA|nr:hypothetical protein T07_3911 [Trichinella nelsoni]
MESDEIQFVKGTNKKVIRGCRGIVSTNLEATEVIRLKDTRPMMEIYNAVYFPSWDQAQNTMNYNWAKGYQRLPARRQGALCA